IDTDADVVAEDITVGPDGSQFTLRAGRERLTLSVGLLGPLNVANAVAAAVTARTVAFDPTAIAEGLAAVSSVPGRLERIETGQPFTVLVDYAHTPAALTAALDAARALPGTRRVIVTFGCGGERDPDKRALLGRG